VRIFTQIPFVLLIDGSENGIQWGITFVIAYLWGQKMREKATYVKPELKAHGSVEEVTKAALSGTKLDGNYVLGTPLSQGILS